MGNARINERHGASNGSSQQMIEVNNLIKHAEQKRGNPNWKPGQSGNPKGRPVGSRQKIAEQLLTSFSAVLDEDPVAALRQLKADDPGKFWTIASGLLPRETLVSVQQAIPGNLSPEEWMQVVKVCDLIAQYAPDGAEAGEIFATIERALIAAYSEPQITIPAPPY